MFNFFLLSAIFIGLIGWFIIINKEKTSSTWLFFINSNLLSLAIAVITLSQKIAIGSEILKAAALTVTILPILLFFNIETALKIKFKHPLLVTIFYLINLAAIGLLGALTFCGGPILNHPDAVKIYLLYLVFWAGFIVELFFYHSKQKKHPLLTTIIFGVGLYSLATSIYLWNNSLASWDNLLLYLGLIFGLLQLGLAVAIVRQFIFDLRDNLIEFIKFCLQISFVLIVAWLGLFFEPAIEQKLWFKLYYLLFGLIAVASCLIISRLLAIIRQKIIKSPRGRTVWQELYRININNFTLSDTQYQLADLFGRIADAKSTRVGYKSNFDQEYYWQDDKNNSFKMIDQDYIEINRYLNQHSANMIITKELEQNNAVLHTILKGYQIDLLIRLKNQHGIVGYIAFEKKRAFDQKAIEQIIKTNDAAIVTMMTANTHDQIIEDNLGLKRQIKDALNEIERSNQEINQIEDVKTDFINISSHQLRTPLSLIKGYLSMLFEGEAGRLTKKQLGLISEGLIASNRMSNSINDFLAISQIQTNTYRLQTKITTIKQLLNDQLETNQVLADSKKIKLKTDFDKQSLKLKFDLDQAKIAQVINNLLNNAINYSPDKSTVKIVSEISQDNWQLTVIDQGFGISKADQKKIFDQLFRGKKAQKHYPDGTGLGLFLSKKIIELHNGKIELLESKKDKGSQFRISLPINKQLN